MAQLFANDTIGQAYKEHMTKEHSGSNWGTTGWKYSGAIMVEQLINRPYVRTVLDFGCGKGTMKRYLKEELGSDIEVFEYDPGIPGKDTLPAGQFDAVITSDVLEHIEPHLLDNVIKLLSEKTRYVLINDIACSPTNKTFGEGPYKGQDLHLTVEEPIWWREKFAEVCPLKEHEYQHREKQSNKGRKPRCLLVHERV